MDRQGQADTSARQREQVPRDAPRRTLRFSLAVASYALGSFNENFFKEAAMLMVVSAGKGYLQGWATVIFTTPYLLLAAAAGWLADRFRKRRVMIGAKVFEIFAMTGGAVGLLLQNWPLVMATGALMATQATVFSPSLNGSIPEVFARRHVNAANAAVRVCVMAMILAGVGLAGVTLGRSGPDWARGPMDAGLVAAVAIAVAVMGFLTCLAAPNRPAADPGKRFPWSGPADTVRRLARMRHDPLLALVVVADTVVWTMGSLEILVINKLGLVQLGVGPKWTGLMVVAELGGFGIGGLLSGDVVNKRTGHRRLAPLAAGMAVFLGAVPAVTLLGGEWRLGAMLGLLLGAGFFGGMVLVPCESFVQIRPPPRQRGSVIAAANFAIFLGIFFSGPLADLLNDNLPPTASFGVIGGMALLLSVGLLIGLRRIETAH